MQTEEVKVLLDKYIAGTCTAAELVQLETWYNKDRQQYMTELDEETIVNDLQMVYNSLPKPAKRISLWPRITMAAAAAAAIVFGVWFYTPRPVVTRNAEIVRQNDIAPGTNKATLTLSNGKSIILSDAKSGVVIDNTRVTYNDGSLVQNGAALPGASEKLILSTPRGGTYQITLSDGTKVWLNAASSLTYAADLNKSGVRSVKLEGEAYFEVAKDKHRPFIVESTGQKVEVLGTHFNINAYTNENSIKTTLVEGSVKISQNGNSKLLKPGEQAQVKDAIHVTNADVNDVLAWKNGKIQFNDQDIQSIMRMLTRWYNIEVSYQGAIKGIGFGGSVSRYKNLSQVLRILEMTGDVHFKIEGRRVTVMP